MSEATKESLEEKVRNSLELMRPYLQSEGIIPTFEYLEGKTLFISIQTKKILSHAEAHLIRLGIEKKILEEFKDLDKVDLV